MACTTQSAHTLYCSSRAHALSVANELAVLDSDKALVPPLGLRRLRRYEARRTGRCSRDSEREESRETHCSECSSASLRDFFLLEENKETLGWREGEDGDDAHYKGEVGTRAAHKAVLEYEAHSLSARNPDGRLSRR